MNPEPRGLQVLAPLHQAVDLTGWILFRPFNFIKWAVIAFAVFLSNCGHGIGPTYQGGNASAYGTASGLPPEVEEVVVAANLSGMAVGVGVYIGSALFFLAFLWLASRMDFVALDCIARNRGHLAPGWDEHGKLGNSLFLLRALLYGVTIPITLAMAFLMMGSAAASAFGGYGQSPDLEMLMRELGANLRAILMMLPLWVLFLLVQAFINNLVLPVMFARRLTGFAALGHCWGLLLAHPGPVLLYLLLQWGLSIAAVIAIGLLGGILSCVLCIFACVPGLNAYIVTLAALPLYAGLRAYSCLFVEQFGPEYRMVRHEADFMALAAESPTTATAERAYVPLPPMPDAPAGQVPPAPPAPAPPPRPAAWPIAPPPPTSSSSMPDLPSSPPSEENPRPMD